MSDDNRDEIARLYTTPLEDGTWMGVPSIARHFGVTNTAVYHHLSARGIKTRNHSEALRGKKLGRLPRPPVGNAPTCRCGCGAKTEWSGNKLEWKTYVTGHYRAHAPYKDPQWLSDQYLKERKTINEIAKMFRVSKPTIRLYMRKFGIEARNGSEAHRGIQRGANNPAWKGGVTPERQRLYKTPEWKSILTEVFTRDSFRCVRCDSPKRRRGDIHAHHIRPFASAPEIRMDASNLVTLCKPCHLWVHSKSNTANEFLAA